MFAKAVGTRTGLRSFGPVWRRISCSRTTCHTPGVSRDNAATARLSWRRPRPVRLPTDAFFSAGCSSAIRLPALRASFGEREASTSTNDPGVEPEEVSSSSPETAQPPPQKTKKKKKQRLDAAVLELHPEFSKNVIQSFIIQGKVLVEGQPVTKAGAQVKHGSKVELIAEVPKYVCRAGLKLEAAFERWAEFQAEGKVAMDAGLSTGGFTDCLLQNGAQKVYGVDVGRGQVAEKLRQDPRLVPMERFNLRHLKADDLPEKVDIVTLDLSFISVLKVLPAVCEVLKPGGQMVVLVKPQFEAGKDKVNTGGVVRDPVVRQEVLETVISGIESMGFSNHGHIESPIKGATSGNTEYLAFFTQNEQAGRKDETTGGLPDAGISPDAGSSSNLGGTE